MIVFPNAKINLGLSIVRKRLDGYHDLETVFYPIELSDILEILPTTNKDEEFRFESLGNNIDCDIENNLVVKAYRKVQNLYNIPSVEMILRKIIPSGAGLGGGSSDATFTVLALNDIFNLNMTKETAIKITSELGSDCPFFCLNEAIYAQGTGNIFTKINCDLSDYKIVVVKPDIFVSTKDAFSNIIPQEKESSVKDIIENCPVEKWRYNLFNDFEKSVFAKYPQIETVKNKLYEIGAVYSSMSGSGASVYGIFKNIDQQTEKEINIQFKDCFVWIQQ